MRIAETFFSHYKTPTLKWKFQKVFLYKQIGYNCKEPAGIFSAGPMYVFQIIDFLLCSYPAYSVPSSVSGSPFVAVHFPAWALPPVAAAVRYVLIYLPIGENLLPVHHQKIKKVIFLCRQADFLASAVYLPAAGVDLQSRHWQYRIFIHLDIFKIRVAFQDFHNLIKSRGILFIKIQPELFMSI